ncbi:MAG TPA: glycine zipper family protein [Candidatus Methylomirabilis sp.]|nr:glycine zipper family protein [Candidatus Methylomirabilis sp.]
MWTRWPLLPFIAVVALAGCATVPAGPSEMVLPAEGKPFEQFQAEDADCRQWAHTQGGTTPGQAWTESALSHATIATLLGAALGAAIGAASGDAGIGAAIGAGSGALGGTLVGVGAGQATAGTVQARYDVAYQQCMYAKGNQIPMRGTLQPRNPAPPPPGPSGFPSSPPPPPPPR